MKIKITNAQKTDSRIFNESEINEKNLSYMLEAYWTVAGKNNYIYIEYISENKEEDNKIERIPYFYERGRYKRRTVRNYNICTDDYDTNVTDKGLIYNNKLKKEIFYEILFFIKSDIKIKNKI